MLLIFGNSIIAFILSTLSQLADSLQSVVPGMSLVSSFLDYVAMAKDDILSAPLALAYAHAIGLNSPLASSTQ